MPLNRKVLQKDEYDSTDLCKQFESLVLIGTQQAEDDDEVYYTAPEDNSPPTITRELRSATSNPRRSSPLWPQPLQQPHANAFSTPQPRSVPAPLGSKKLSLSSKARATSVPPNAGSTKLATQCSGITNFGQQCARRVNSGPALLYQSPGILLNRFCFQHEKAVLKPTGFYSHAKGNDWVDFAKWIPEYLQPKTQASLRAEMEKPASIADEPGYIYAYEIRNPNTPNEVHIKVGRALHLVKRLNEWSKQCVSREVILRGWWPGTIEHNNQDDVDSVNGSASLLKGIIKPGERGKHCHRPERLVHLELADVALNNVHLSSAFRNNTQSQAIPATTPVTSSKSTKITKKPCPDCGAVHREIFTLERAISGAVKGHEWEKVVQPIIEKWGSFVNEYV